MLDDDLERMRRSPGSVSRRDLVAALREAGYEVAHRSKHETWANGDSVIAVPWTPKGSGTIRAIVTAIIEARKG